MGGEQFNVVGQIFMGHFQQFAFKAHTVHLAIQIPHIYTGMKEYNFGICLTTK